MGKDIDIRAVDLFCGVGGLTHGLELAGVNVQAGVDLDPACKFAYEENNAAGFVESDVNSLSAEMVSSKLSGGDYSLLAGCAPCQPFSTYARSGRSKKRPDDWSLAASFGKLVQEVQPDFVTMENVAQLASHSVFSQFRRSLKGYKIDWKVVESSDIGVPQSRKRLVLVASRHGKIKLEIPSASQKATVRSAISMLPAIQAGVGNNIDPMHVASALSALNLRRIQASRPGGTWRDWDNDLLAACHVRETGATYPSVYGRMEWDRVAPTITTQCFGYGNGRFGHPEQDRAISLREAAILQTFPRDYKFLEPGERPRFSTLGRLIGNAVPVRLGEFIGDTFMKHAATIS